MSEEISGQNWNEFEVALCVDAYFEHLELDLAGKTFVKTHLYRDLAAKTGRSIKSIERKFQNISAVLDKLGRPWIKGLAPLANYQHLLADVIGARGSKLRSLDILPEYDGLQETSLYVGDPPTRISQREALPAYMKELVRKFDPVERDMRNRALGEEGERLVFNNEKSKLRLGGRKDLAKNVRWIAKEEGDGAGYDILSFDDRGEVRYIEVKSTTGGDRTPFFITRNELAFANAKRENYHLLRLYDFRRLPQAFEIHGELEKFIRLSTETYRADFHE